MIHLIDFSLLQFLHSDRVRFDAADLDKNHQLSASELAMFLWPQHYPSLKQTQALMILASLDTNQDMAVTMDEFVGEYWFRSLESNPRNLNSNLRPQKPWWLDHNIKVPELDIKILLCRKERKSREMSGVNV
ncbi:unnamed protein product [Echinostoma caproni]|uniref:EF-hand domain-containing protein n=1 Tax=Echinostoma caproni TaxID=27848 RepID=A0A183ATG8_9TREM|nr:unnamed protein product [Echinostoma caproni]